MTSDTKLVIGVAIFSVIIIIGSVFLIGKNESGVPKRESLGSASMTLDKKSADLGDMKVEDERTTTFTITNTSNSTLRLWNITTSCNCTFASLVINGQETGEFNMPMHTSGNLRNWIGEVSPQQTALLKVNYRPKVMPVVGKITRSVTFETNDPNNQNVQVDVSANVL